MVDKVAALQQLLADTEQEQVLLKTQAKTTQKRLNMAGKLTSALSEEGVRWSETATQIQVAIPAAWPALTAGLAALSATGRCRHAAPCTQRDPGCRQVLSAVVAGEGACPRSPCKEWSAGFYPLYDCC